MDISYLTLKEKLHLSPEVKITNKHYSFLDYIHTRTDSLMTHNQGSILIGSYRLSIIAHRFSYCTPRDTLRDLKDYTAMEMALLQDSKFVSLNDPILLNFPLWSQLGDCLCDEYAIFGYVPVEIIQQFYEYLKDTIND